MMTPISTTDPVNAQILSVSEDKIQGFQIDPLGEISRLSGVDLPTVRQRLAAMLRGGTIRRIRQTLMATSLAKGALIAWQVPEEKLQAAFEWMYRDDPFSGHVVIRSTDTQTAGSKYRLWTTLKVPQGFSIERHAEFLAHQVGAISYKLLPAKKLFVLGVGHVRRRGMEPGSKSLGLADVLDTKLVELSDLDWRVLTALKREFTAEEIESAPFSLNPEPRTLNPFWSSRAAEANVALDEFHAVARSLNARGVIGRFSTFLEHVKQLKTGEQVTRYNALFHWAVPSGRELEAGREVGRFDIMTHAYWREAGPEFNDVNIMGVAHGTDKQLVLAHKAAIDAHLAEVGIPVSYSNVFWGGRSEIKPSEISPIAYVEFCKRHDLDIERMRHTT
jgi:DNA-binding Lrp family transcriptional regulator